MPDGDNAKLLAAVREWAAQNTPGLSPDYIQIHYPHLPVPVTLPVTGLCALPPTPAARPPESFVPTPYQQAILDALEGKALRTDELAAATGGDQRRLFRTRGLKELREYGLVNHHSRLGYYRPDAPPEELLDEIP